MFGLLNINKPLGVTSRDVVDRIQDIVRPHKAGHAGTLDPLATGVLVVCVGQATRLVEYIQRMPKSYRAKFLLGRRSDTEDVDGHVEEITNPPCPTRQQIEDVLPKFIGAIDQRPPAYSALKVRGRRAYDLARSGKQVELHPRRVAVYDVSLRDYQYPELHLDICCGSGTYVRSLGRDIAESLGTSAVMATLVRAAIGPFRVEDALSLAQLQADRLQDQLLPAVQALGDLPQLELDDDQVGRLAHGQSIRHTFDADIQELAAVDSSGELVAILVPRGTGILGPSRFFPPARGRRA